MTAHTYPPACTECHEHDAETDDGLCRICADMMAWAYGASAYSAGDLSSAGSREIAEITLKRRNET